MSSASNDSRASGSTAMRPEGPVPVSFKGMLYFDVDTLSISSEEGPIQENTKDPPKKVFLKRIDKTEDIEDVPGETDNVDWKQAAAKPPALTENKEERPCTRKWRKRAMKSL